MKVSLEKSKNGETTATCNNHYLHSSYNPSREAERFLSTINIDYEPPYIVVAEPGLGYIIPLLRTKFPSSKIVIIRFCSELISYNSQGDYYINYFDLQLPFGNQLINIISEENIVNTLFLQWPPAIEIFSDFTSKLVQDIKLCFNNAKTLLVTREYFEKKWFLNSISFIKYSNNFIELNEKIDKPVLIVSSGPSLKDVIPIIQINRENFFILCLSSAVKVLINNKIIPDMIMSTDGGYWAGQHLKSLYKYDIPLAMPAEAYVQKQLIQKLNILPLDYGDGLSSQLLKTANIKCLKAERNGTVSGTALSFALTYSTEDIYFCGLDMCGQRGFQHCQPNENEKNNILKDNLLNHNEKRAVIAEYSKNVLDIYKEWFYNLKLDGKKVYRIINNSYKKNSLGQIKDINTRDFLSMVKIKTNNKEYFKPIKVNKNLNDMKSYIDLNLNTNPWNNLLFPLSTSSLIHNINNEEIKNRIIKENHRLSLKIGKMLND